MSETIIDVTFGMWKLETAKSLLIVLTVNGKPKHLWIWNKKLRRFE